MVQKKIINKIKINRNSIVLLLGNGSVARVVYEILKEKNVKTIYLCARNFKKFQGWKLRKVDKKVSWRLKGKIKAALMINATPIGMKGTNQEKLFEKKQLKISR